MPIRALRLSSGLGSRRLNAGVTRRVVVLAAALLGLLLMHGVSAHGAHAAGAHPAGHGADHAIGARLDQPHAAVRDGVPAVAPAAEPGCEGGCARDAAAPTSRELSQALVALCLTIVLATGVLLLLGSSGPRGSCLVALRRPPASGPATAAPARPPDLHVLSILRC